MSCAVCGNPRTVKSHLVPSAFAHEIRAGDKDLTILAEGAQRPNFSQSGLFDPGLLCGTHEGVTGELDRYGVAFIRRVREARSSSGMGFQVPNPEPEKLLRFASSIVWRAVVSPLGNVDRKSLGRLEPALADNVFKGAPLEARLHVGSISIQHDSKELLIVIMPTRRREAGVWLWSFALNGCFFTLFLGAAKLPPSLQQARADILTEPVVARLENFEARDWTGLASVIRSISRMPQRGF